MEELALPCIIDKSKKTITYVLLFTITCKYKEIFRKRCYCKIKYFFFVLRSMMVAINAAKIHYMLKSVVYEFFFCNVWYLHAHMEHQRKHFITKISPLIYMYLVWLNIYINGNTNKLFNDDKSHLHKHLPVLSITYTSLENHLTWYVSHVYLHTCFKSENEVIIIS